MSLLVRLLPLVLLLPACRHVPSRAECTAHEGTAWREVTSEHFRIVTNLDSEEAADAARELELARKSLLFAWDYRLDPPGRLDVVVLQSQRQLQEFVPDNVAGFFARDLHGPLIVFSGNLYSFGAASPERSVIMHELAHYLSAYALPRQPRWFAEGLAEYLETTRPWGDGTQVRMGEAPRYRLYWAKSNGRIPFEKLWAWGTSSGMRPSEVTAHYATSWLWVHFLISKHGDRFSEFQKRLGRAEEPREAWKKAFEGVSQTQLDKELSQYVAHGIYPAFRYKMPEVKAAVSERSVPDAEVHALRARLALLRPSDDAEASMTAFKREISAALQQQPDNFAAAYMRLFEYPNTDPHRVELARALTRQHPSESRAWYELSSSLFKEKHAGPNAERRAAVVKAVQLAPGDHWALNSLAWDYVISGSPKTALPFARKAAGLAPWSPEILDTWAASLAGSGLCADAVAIQKRAVDMLHEQLPEQDRARYVDRLQRYEAGCLQNDGT